MMDDELFYKIAITKVPKVGAILSKSLIGYCGGAGAVFKSKKKDLIKIPGIGEVIAESISKGIGLDKAEQEIKYLEQQNTKVLFYLDDDYPQRLRRYHDCPVLLYYKGNVNLNQERVVAIVGTRKPSSHGKIACEDLVSDLKKYNVLVISGLAYGVDITAHKKCVDLGIPNIGVMGHGMSMIYPADHQRVADRMVQNGGLLTEFTHKTTPEREFFPMRNRIIAGMCDALVVVETAMKGGSMISAHMARDYDKKVFAIPGRLKDSMSEGCNHLIKLGDASLYENANDIASALNWSSSKNTGVQQSLFVELNKKEQRIVQELKVAQEIGIDKLCQITEIDSGEMASLLLDLEFRGLIKAKPGKRFILR